MHNQAFKSFVIPSEFDNSSYQFYLEESKNASNNISLKLIEEEEKESININQHDVY
jgi:hypothetical protein